MTADEALNETPTVVESVGFVIGCKGPYLVLASDRHDDHLNNVGRIPLTWILTFSIIEAPHHG